HDRSRTPVRCRSGPVPSRQVEARRRAGRPPGTERRGTARWPAPTGKDSDCRTYGSRSWMVAEWEKRADTTARMGPGCGSPAAHPQIDTVPATTGGGWTAGTTRRPCWCFIVRSGRPGAPDRVRGYYKIHHLPPVDGTSFHLNDRPCFISA